MTEAELAIGAPPPAERDENSVGAIARRRWESWKAGDVGVMPVVIGLIVIVAFFYSQNSNFLTAGNFTNLMVQMAGVTTIAIGVVFVLLLGEIDLSIGYVSGIAGVVVAKLTFPDGSWEATGIVAIVIAVDISADIQDAARYTNGLDVMIRANSIRDTTLVRYLTRMADVVVEPAVKSIHWADFAAIDTAIEAGDAAAGRAGTVFGFDPADEGRADLQRQPAQILRLARR